jgi:hypothetical protein
VCLWHLFSIVDTQKKGWLAYLCGIPAVGRCGEHTGGGDGAGARSRLRCTRLEIDETIEEAADALDGALAALVPQGRGGGAQVPAQAVL